jgi:peptide/nickel transport system ATP-binding protein
MSEPLLEIKNVTKVFGGGLLSTSKPVVALDDYSLNIYDEPAKITTIAGESGSGKTTLVNLVLGYLPPSEGQVLYKGVSLQDMDYQQRLAYRREVQAVFQDPYEVYNPFYRVQHIFDMVMRNFHLRYNKNERRDRIEEALNLVGLRGEEILEKYPHQLSGGQRQRVMVARACMLKPRLIVADEPVSAVDASLRAMILDIMLKLRDDFHISFLYITHDLSTAYQISDEMYVLFQGVTTERGNAAAIIEDPKHPYVQQLINSIPVPDPTIKWDTDIHLPSEEEMRMKYAKGCRFYPRCLYGMDICKEKQPPEYPVGEDHLAACYLYRDKQP